MLPSSETPLHLRLQQLAHILESKFLDRTEAIRCLLITTLAGENSVLIGPPGTAKSALAHTFAKLCNARYFEYLLTRFTEPNELFGPIDITAFRAGTYQRRTAGMLPEAEIVFLDEIFKSNSAILNSLLTLLNERRYLVGNSVIECPLITVIGASNEVPTDAELAALFDRFLLRVRLHYIDAFHFQALLLQGLKFELNQSLTPLVTSFELRHISTAICSHTHFEDSFLNEYRSLILQIRAEGISVSDRRVVKLLKLCAASAFLDGRSSPNLSDLFILKHIWNTEDQISILSALVNPILESYYHEHPQSYRIGVRTLDLDSIETEIEQIRSVFAAGNTLSDVQIFSQLRSLSELKNTLAGSSDVRAQSLNARIDTLLDSAFKGGRFGIL